MSFVGFISDFSSITFLSSSKSSGSSAEESHTASASLKKTISPFISSNAFALIGPKLLGKAIDAMQIEDELGNKFVDFKQVFYYAILMVIFYI